MKISQGVLGYHTYASWIERAQRFRLRATASNVSSSSLLFTRNATFDCLFSMLVAGSVKYEVEPTPLSPIVAITKGSQMDIFSEKKN